MSVNPISTQQGKYVKVNPSINDSVPRYYAVPKKNADVFVKDFKHQAHKISIMTNTVFFTSIFAGIIGAMFATKNIKMAPIRFTLNALGGVALGMGSFMLCGKYAEKEQTKLEHKYGAIHIKA